jgi:uncharacterized protein (TIGR02596 family)
MTMKTRLPSDKIQSAFSLVELLVVIAIIGIIGGFAIPAVGSLLKGSSITQAANIITDQTAAAHQQALTRNRPIEVRFYSFIDPEDPGATTPYFRGLQYFEITPAGIANPVGKVALFPNTVIMNSTSTLSSLLGTNASPGPIVTTPTSNDPDLPRGVGKNYTYIPFRFLPDGSTSLPATGAPANGQWFITVHLLSDLVRTTNGTPPPNFFTWMVDPVSGASKVLRPGVKANTGS